MDRGGPDSAARGRGGVDSGPVGETKTQGSRIDTPFAAVQPNRVHTPHNSPLAQEDTNLCAIHAKRVTIMPRDLQLARRIRGPVHGAAAY